MTPTFVACVSRHVSGTNKRLSQLRTSHLVMVGASLHDYLAINDLISTHILSDYGHIWVVFAFALNTNIFEILDSKIKNTYNSHRLCSNKSTGVCHVIDFHGLFFL